MVKTTCFQQPVSRQLPLGERTAFPPSGLGSALAAYAARAASSLSSVDKVQVLLFNTRTYIGCDTDVITIIAIHNIFQHTHPHGCDPRGMILTSVIADFNTRIRMGCDSPTVIFICDFFDFNTRTRMGATAKQCTDYLGHSISTHAPAWVRLTPFRHYRCLSSFQHTHPQGCDTCPVKMGLRLHFFDTRTHMDATSRK